MKFTVSKGVTDKYPDLNIGVVVCHNVAARADTPALVDALVRERVKKLTERFPDAHALEQHPFVQAWRDIYRSFGVKPKRHKPTMEALALRVIRDGAMPRISSLVDTYLAIELQTLLPFGGYDLDTLQGDLFLDISTGGELFRGLGTGEAESTNAGEVVYKDVHRVLTRRWNYRDAFDTRIRPESANVILMVEGASPLIPDAAVADAAEALRQAYILCFDGEFSVTLVKVAEPCVEL